jgi:prefoldin alpha subunit
MPGLTQEEKEKLEKLASELNIREFQTEILRQQLSAITRSLTEYTTAAETLKTLQNETGEKESLVSVGANCYVPAKLRYTDKVLVGVGAGVLLEKTLAEAVQILEVKIKELQEALQNTRKELETVSAEAEKLRPELEKLLEKTRS